MVQPDVGCGVLELGCIWIVAGADRIKLPAAKQVVQLLEARSRGLSPATVAKVVTVVAIVRTIPETNKQNKGAGVIVSQLDQRARWFGRPAEAARQ